MNHTSWQDEAVIESELSPRQEALLRRHESGGGVPACTMTRGYRLRGQLHRKSLERALSTVVSRHDGLRTIYPLIDGRVTPRILPDTYFAVEYQEIAHAAGNSQSFIDERLLQHGVYRFDLQRELPIRAEVVRVAPNDHLLILTIHEIAADEVSWEILMAELERAYGSLTGADLVPQEWPSFELPSEPELNLLGEAPAEWFTPDALSFDLPDDSGVASDLRPSIINEVSAPMSEPLYRQMKQYCTRSGVVLMVAILAAFGVLLFRYTRKDFLLVGKLISGRTRIESKNVIGCLRDVVAMQSPIIQQAGFAQMLDQVSRRVSTGLIPPDSISTDASGVSPLRVMFEERIAHPLNLAGLAVDCVRRTGSSFQPDLKLVVESQPTQLLLRVAFNSARMSKSSATRLLGHLETILAAGISQPDAPLISLPMLTAPEKEQLAQWNKTQQSFPLTKSYPALFEDQVRQHPDLLAVRALNRELSYAKLNSRANQLANYLRNRGLRENAVIGLCMTRSVDLAAAMLGVWKAGAAYLPLDSAYPKSTLEYMVDDSQADFILTDDAHVASCAAFRAVVINLDEPETQRTISLQSVADNDSERAADNIAYVIYTSGSTGRPKGVQITHRSLLNHNLGVNTLFKLSSTDRVLQFSALSFDISVEELFPTWLSGAAVVFRPEKLFLTVDDFLDFVRKEKITVLDLPTAYWHELVNALSSRSLPSSVRLVVIGGEQASQKHYAEWQKFVGPSVKLINTYGLTETTVSSTAFLGDTPVGRGVPIGRPMANTQAFILDANMQPVPPGVIGELYIGGEGVAHGYLNRPELTAEKFIPNPADPNARLCKTGDRARFLDDGNILFLGRGDDQLKIRGFRIEPGQIEAAFSAHPEVRQCKILAQETAGGEKRLVAYVVHSDNIDLPELRQHLADRLPEHMVPSAIVRLEALPLTPNGKVDRRALPPVETSSVEVVQSSGDLEQRLTAIWQGVFGRRGIKRDDTFIDLGGHSLLALRLMTEIERQIGRKLPPGSFSENTSIAQLASVLAESAPVMTGFEHLVALKEEGTLPPLYLVHGIGGGMLWGYQNLVKHLHPEQPVYFLRSRGLEGSPEYTTVEEMAAAYIEEIRRHQPVGPYLLAGYCFAGNVAYEMACQLAQDGQRVSNVILLNAMAPNSDYYNVRLTPAFAWRFIQNSVLWVRHFRTWDREVKRDFIARKWRTLAKAAMGGKSGVMPAEEMMNLSGYTRLEKELWNTHLLAWERHVPKNYRGNVVLFRTRIHPFWCTFAEDFGWRQFATDNFTVKIVPGQHANILQDPYVKGLAKDFTEVAADTDFPAVSCKSIEV